MSPAWDEDEEASGDWGAGVLEEESAECSFSSSRSLASSFATFARRRSVWLIWRLSS